MGFIAYLKRRINNLHMQENYLFKFFLDYSFVNKFPEIIWNMIGILYT